MAILTFVAVCGLLAVVSGGYSLAVVHGLIIEVASLCCGRGSRVHGLPIVVAQGLQSAGSGAVLHGHICCEACEIFLDQGSN